MEGLSFRTKYSMEEVGTAAETLAAEATDRLVHRMPELMGSFGPERLERTRKDFAHHFRYFSASGMRPDDGLILDYLAWLKPLFDRFGHDQGDRALIALAEILETTFRSSDLCARMGGDEFVALAEAADAPVVEQLLGRFDSRLREWNAGSGFDWELSSSYGYALYDPSSPSDLEELLKKADEAMYEAKRKKRARSGYSGA